MKESEIEAYFVKRVKELGGWQRKFVSPNCKGVPDRVVMFPRWATVRFVEFKAVGKKLSVAQIMEHKKMTLAGCYTLTVFSILEVDRLLEC